MRIGRSIKAVRGARYSIFLWIFLIAPLNLSVSQFSSLLYVERPVALSATSFKLWSLPYTHPVRQPLHCRRKSTFNFLVLVRICPFPPTFPLSEIIPSFDINHTSVIHRTYLDSAVNWMFWNIQEAQNFHGIFVAHHRKVVVHLAHNFPKVYKSFRAAPVVCNTVCPSVVLRPML